MRNNIYCIEQRKKKRTERKKTMEMKEEERSRGEEKEVYKPLLNSPCSALHKAVQAILKCLGLESSSVSPSSSSEEEEDTGTAEETGFMGMVSRLTKRKGRPGYSTGSPGQIN